MSKPAPVGLTTHELRVAEQDNACPVPPAVPGYWLGSAEQWRARALEAEAALARLRERLREWRPLT
jgi:hypothetical protein